MKANKLVPKIKQNKLQQNPLFIKFLNWTEDKYTIYEIMSQIYNQVQSFKDKEIIKKRIETLTDDYLNNLSSFKKVFQKYMDETISIHNISESFLAWLNNAFKYIKESVALDVRNEERTLEITDSEGRWFEGFICYNFIMTFNYFSVFIIKQCPVCNKYFCHKGKYAKYCSDTCKGTTKGE